MKQQYSCDLIWKAYHNIYANFSLILPGLLSGDEMQTPHIALESLEVT